MQQRRFSAAAPPDERDELALTHVQCDSLQCANALAVACIFFAGVLEGKNHHASNRRPRGRYFSHYFRLLSVFSIAEVRSFASGSTSESNRASTLPSGPIRNLLKFHPISPPAFSFPIFSSSKPPTS